ncbi:MAG: DEAD/DEAH box helicase family protein [Clostridia bacterium]|nr:DEAD/DEAH box helicase family protein [Clostridia bacterium]
MSYRDLKIEKCYETTENQTHLLDEFYIPMLEQSKHYFRIAGFFSSSSLMVASKGIEGLISNNGSMRLLISPKLSEQDVQILKEYGTDDLPDTLSIFQAYRIEDFSKLDNLQALAWLLANKKLEIKIVVDKNSGQSIFHQKIGIGYDSEGNMISFSGSINETAQAWLGNIEEFKTFKSWEPGQAEYLIADLKKFNEYWNGERDAIASVYDIPQSIKNQIIQVAPRDVRDLAIMKKYHSESTKKPFEISLFAHQSSAVKMWEENDHQLLMEMATGTGKTRTAIGCMLRLLNKKKDLLVIVATPQNTLSRQWKRDIEEELGITADTSKIIDGSNPKWKNDLEICLLDLNSQINNNTIVYTTHSTLSDKKFINIIESNRGAIEIMLICDEVHAIGSDHQREALLGFYQYRVGLSATPERMFDEHGTGIIRNYFGDRSFEFTIKDALGTINPYTGKPFLNPFYYHPVFVDLDDDERSRYSRLSREIAVVASAEEVDQERLNMLLIRRANILKNASEKMQAVEELVEELERKGRVRDTIIFATDKQIAPVLDMLGKHSISRCKITEEESTSKKMGVRGNTEREEYIEQFRQGEIQVLVGIKCLDEGIDIKTARIAVLMASSTNPREFVQRVGRVIRPSKNKTFSHIYDLIVRPTGGGDSDIRILEKEAKRAMQIAENAINKQEVIEIFEENGVVINAYQ